MKYLNWYNPVTCYKIGILRFILSTKLKNQKINTGWREM